MGKETEIEWTDSTINPTSGCDGCELYRRPPDGFSAELLKAWLKKQSCYAAHVHQNRLAPSFPQNYAASFHEVRLISKRMIQAADWADLKGMPREGKPWLDGRPRHIFLGDMGDFLSAAVTDEFIESEILRATTSKNGQRHIWQWLTKRPGRLAQLSEKWGGLPDNVVAMTTITNQRTADVRIPDLLRVRCRTRGISAEPLLGKVRLSEEWLSPASPSRVHHLICGGESGNNARPMNPDYPRALRDQAARNDVRFFFKQWGDWSPHCPTSYRLEDVALFDEDENGDQPVLLRDLEPERRESWDEHQAGDIRMYHVGKRKAGRLLDGREHNEMPL